MLSLVFSVILFLLYDFLFIKPIEVRNLSWNDYRAISNFDKKSQAN